MAARLKFLISLIIFVWIVLLGRIFSSQSARASGPWYVATHGNDLADCLSPTTPCLTVNSAIGKAASGDSVFVAAGKYFGSGDEVVLIDKDIYITGGWDTSFSTQNGTSVIDGEFRSRGITVNSSITAYLEYFTIQNGNHPEGDNGISNDGNLTLEKVTIKNNGTLSSAGNIGGIYNSPSGILTSLWLSQRNFSGLSGMKER